VSVSAVALLLFLLFPAFGTGETTAESYYLLPGRQGDGNRHYPGRLPLSQTASARLPDRAAWVVGFNDDRDRPRWHVETSDGRLFAVRLTGATENHSALEVTPLGLSEAPSWAPPVLFFEEPPCGEPRLGSLADLLVPPESLDNAPLVLDAFPAVSPEGWTALLGRGTTAYPHGALGDLTEAGSIVVVRSDGSHRVIDLGPDVAEETGVLLADVNGDGRDEIVTVLANSTTGARIVALNPGGAVIAEGPPVGRGFRWRHIIGSGILNPETGREIVVVRTPHIGGVLELYRYRNGRLEIAAEATGFSSHRLGSANLGQGMLVDTTGNGYPEMILPDQRQTSLRVLQRTPEGVSEIRRLTLPARLSGNLSVASPCTSGGTPALLAGSEDGTITVWY
jgi:hypothetical protein